MDMDLEVEMEWEELKTELRKEIGMGPSDNTDLLGSGPLLRMAGNSSHLCPTLNTISLYKYLALTVRPEHNCNVSDIPVSGFVNKIQ